MVSIKNLSFAFKKNEPLFNGLNLDLQPGKTYGLFGLNGAGKSSLLNIMTGMLFPAKGECMVFGKESRERDPLVLSELFIVPEQFDLPSLPIRKYIALHAPFYPRFDVELLNRAMEIFEVNGDKKLPDLSYGQRKKFLISFAFATQTKLLLMDEPTNGLDIPSKSQFRKLQASLQREDRCVVISTHQVRDLGSMIDHITVLKDGNIVFNHSLEEILSTISFQKTDPNPNEEILYSEEILGGLHAITPYKNRAKETDIDLELLFNGIIHQTETITREFKSREK
ncbi:ABC transporter ATP-binding protein [Rhodohalobacter sp. SW132]|uniref:ABC transporter ATP-binding protein n=1 Tax=Rhodohalobacter sp. SW132 TaxID=2293433 RepID=UPI000E282DCC|nr:ABC transporter ATP-binding protein [Rhodohalobacter sp. SW132]REL33464.1 ABC transporter ATP-binding protein [Rhodohalobacter sp. SW132]